MSSPREHVDALRRALGTLDIGQVEQWGVLLSSALVRGHRLLVAGNGGSAAHAQHLTAELVGRYRDERMPLSAIALHTETSSVTAIANDYGYDEVFARQVRAHGRPGDILLAITTSGRSANVLRAAIAAHEQRIEVWALTGQAPNPLADTADETLAVNEAFTSTVQEIHQVAVHLLCEVVDREARTLAGATG